MDWRISNQKEYIYQANLKRIDYANKTTMCEHDHCEFCMSKFSNSLNDLHTGYCTMDEYYWICEECFADFAEMFDWTVVEDNCT